MLNTDEQMDCAEIYSLTESVQLSFAEVDAASLLV